MPKNCEFKTRVIYSETSYNRTPAQNMVDCLYICLIVDIQGSIRTWPWNGIAAPFIKEATQPFWLTIINI